MLKPSFDLALLLTTLVALGPLSTELYLPSLPTLTIALCGWGVLASYLLLVRRALAAS